MASVPGFGLMGVSHVSGTAWVWTVMWSRGICARLGQLEYRLSIRCIDWTWERERDGHDYLVCRLSTACVIGGAFRGDHLAFGLGIDSWHVVWAWSLSHDKHRWDLGYVTWWASR